MFRTDLLSIIRSLNTVFTAVGICHITISIAVNNNNKLKLGCYPVAVAILHVYKT